jgi:caffeoyl-CoA O-methyltransferase
MSVLDTSPRPVARPVTPVGILAAQLEGLSQQLDGVEAVSSQLKAQLRGACALASGLDPYLSRCSTPESPALRSLAERTQAEDWGRRPSSPSGTQLEQEMLSGHIEGQFLQFLAYMTRATRVLDIGMFTGYSALAMAEALPNDGQVVACEVDPYVAEFAAECFSRSPFGSDLHSPP